MRSLRMALGQLVSCRILYVINSFDRGGAEAGLIQMVRGGVFADCELLIVALVRGAGGAREDAR